MSEVPESVTRREVLEVLRTFAASHWTGMTLEVRGMRITVGRHGAPATTSHQAGPEPARAERAAPPAPAPLAPAPPAPAAERSGSGVENVAPATGSAHGAVLDTTGLVEVTSPAVGAFWVAPSPGQPAFVAVGQSVGLHEQLAIVEVMKLMNPVTAPVAGEVVHVLAADAEMVEYEQVLFLIRPTDG